MLAIAGTACQRSANSTNQWYSGWSIGTSSTASAGSLNNL